MGWARSTTTTSAEERDKEGHISEGERGGSPKFMAIVVRLWEGTYLYVPDEVRTKARGVIADKARQMGVSK